MSSTNKPAEELELELEVNEKQAIFLEAVTSHHYEVAAMIGGRGSGKSVTLGDFLMYCVEEMPKARGGWGVKTVAKAKSKLTAGIKSAWLRWGITEYDFKTGLGCYVLWREPPAHFDRPYQSPDNWENCISFPNGFVIEMESFKLSADENRGSNFDFYVIDEGLNFKKAWLKVVLPTLRANVGKFSSPLHQMLAVFSSPPWTPDAAWLHEIEDLSKKEPNNYFYLEVKTKDNQAFLPENYIARLRKQLTRLEFKVEVEGERISKLPNGFYPNFQYNVHVVKDEADLEELEATVYNGELFYQNDQELELSLDFNAHFTSASVWQSEAGLSRQVDNVFVKEADEGLTMAQTWAARFVADYSEHRKRKVTLTGDRNGKNKSAGSTDSMFDQVAKILRAEGWLVTVSPLNFNPPHKDKFVLISDVLSERDPNLFRVRFDGNKCKATVISIENSPLNADYSKNKGSESSGIEQERATHLSDTVDYFIIWKLKGGATVNYSDFDVSLL
ncbi:hypothetical protein [Spirosoma sp.]|uniref:hypothetical protein n=1 Tax=Spirosoma sp. TaxID=1899569 RepID=UPI002610D863|nr:hypothetical protein [Spirosoma sp.]MCX6216551.1 hypothetical protein [Spirosoma sp.]